MRSIVASLLALLLLGGASWASVCDLSCQLQAKQQCMSPSMEHAAMPMACGHCPGMASRNTSEDTVTTACGTMDCGHAVLQHARASEDAPTALANPHQMVIALVVPALSDGVATYGAYRNPPEPFSAFHPLLVSLRI